MPTSSLASISSNVKPSDPGKFPFFFLGRNLMIFIILRPSYFLTACNLDQSLPTVSELCAIDARESGRCGETIPRDSRNRHILMAIIISPIMQLVKWRKHSCLSTDPGLCCSWPTQQLLCLHAIGLDHSGSILYLYSASSTADRSSRYDVLQCLSCCYMITNNIFSLPDSCVYAHTSITLSQAKVVNCFD